MPACKTRVAEICAFNAVGVYATTLTECRARLDGLTHTLLADGEPIRGAVSVGLARAGTAGEFKGVLDIMVAYTLTDKQR